MSRDPSRRDVLRAGLLLGGGLWVGCLLPGCAPGSRLRLPSGEVVFAPNAWIQIAPDERIRFVLDRVEMGQGVMTSHTMIVAEELEVDPAVIEVEQAPADRRYDNPALGFQITGGSTSVRTSWQPLREAAASARETLVAAAAAAWGVPPGSCKAQPHGEGGAVVHEPTGRSLTYGALAERAAELRVQRGRPKDPASFRVIGTDVPRVDARPKVDGTAVFGLDVRVPGMLHAVVVRHPGVSGQVKLVSDARARAVPGVVSVVSIPSGVGVVARSHFQARKAAALLEVTLEDGPARPDSAEIRARWAALLDRPGRKVRSAGNAEKALAGAARTLEARYELPFVAHATMEPPNCTASVTAAGVEVWAPTQSPAAAREIAARTVGVPQDKVTIHTTLLGGGFGRRIAQEYVAEAVHLSRAVGAPVQVIWSRADDLQHDIYRPAGLHAVRAGLDASGRLVAWHHRMVSPSISAQVAGDFLKLMLPTWSALCVGPMLGPHAEELFKGRLVDPTTVEGADSVPYAIENLRVELHHDDPGVPLGFWRSVGHSTNAFVVESFVDEVAHAAGQDPYLFRRALLARAPRHRAVLDRVAEAAGWGTPPPPGVFRGIAQHASFESFAAHVVEVEVEGGALRIRRVVAAVDCGRVIHPDLVAAQLEGAAIFALSAAQKHRITLTRGAVDQSNFHDYELLRIHEAPRSIETHVIASDAPPTGVGEPGVPPVAPALANAIFAATGRRLRELPLDPGAAPVDVRPAG